MNQQDLKRNAGDSSGESTALREIFAYLWSGRVLISAFVLVFFIIGYVWVWISPPRYEASVVFAPAASSAAAGSADVSMLSSAAHLVGLSAGAAATTTEFTKFGALLTSDVLAAEMVKRHPVLQGIYAGQWDASTKSWHAPSGLGPIVSSAVKAVLGMPRWSPPSSESLSAYLSGNVTVSPDVNTGLVEVDYDSPNRALAKQLLTWMHDDADLILRRSARTQTTNRISYLQRTLPTVTIADQRNAMIALLSQMMQTKMIIESDSDWAAIPLDPPSLSANPVWPKPLLILPASIVVGAILGICMFLFLTQLEVDVRGLTFRGLWRKLRRSRAVHSAV